MDLTVEKVEIGELLIFEEYRKVEVVGFTEFPAYLRVKDLTDVYDTKGVLMSEPFDAPCASLKKTV